MSIVSESFSFLALLCQFSIASGALTVIKMSEEAIKSFCGMMVRAGRFVRVHGRGGGEMPGATSQRRCRPNRIRRVGLIRMRPRSMRLAGTLFPLFASLYAAGTLSTAASAPPNVSPAPAADNLAATAENYRPIMIKDIDRSLAGAQLMEARLEAGDLAGAQKAWIDSRVGWERAEVFIRGYPGSRPTNAG